MCIRDRPTVAAPTTNLSTSARRVEAIGIVGGSGATLLDDLGGASVRALTAGTIINVTGRSEDSGWLTAYTNDGVAGWLEASRVTLYGGEGLAVVQPGLSAEEITSGQAAVPSPTPTEMISETVAATVAPTLEATATPVPPTPTAAMAAAPVAPADGSVTAVVRSVGLYVRAGPGTDYAVVGTVLQGDQLSVMGRNAAISWVQIVSDKAPEGYGWVGAGLVDFSGDVKSVPVSTQTSSDAVVPTPVSSTPAASAPTASSVGGTASPAGLQGTLVFQNGDGQIYAYNLAAGSLRPLAAGMDPAISPDGSEVAFVRGGGEVGVYRIGIDGSNEVRIFSGNDVRTPSWSPDGQYVVFSRVTGSTRCYDLGMGGCIAEGEAQTFFNSLPPAQQQQVQDAIANGTIKLVDKGLRGLSRVDRDGNNYRDIPSLDSAYAPDWNSSDAIVYENNGNLQITADRPDATTESVTTERGLRDPAWQANYGRVATHRQEGSHWEIYVINPDGGGLAALTRPARIPNGQSSSVSPAWSPDGQQIVFLSNRANGVWGLWVMNADGGNQRQLPVSVPLDYRYQGEQMVSWGG